MLRWAARRLCAPLKAFVRTKDSSELVPRHIEMVDTRQKCMEVLPLLMSERAVALDCEGVGLGRWGRLCLLQMATQDKVFLFDPLRDGVVSALAPVLTSGRIAKIMHDCREDVSALYHQFGIVCDGVYDTQIAHFMLLEQSNYAPYQISLNDLLVKMLGFGNQGSKAVGDQMRSDPQIWFYRPISQDLIEYAVQDVVHLPALRELLLKKNSRNFRVNREMRGKFSVVRPPIAKFLIEMGMKLQGEIMANFQILAPKTKSELEIYFSTSKSKNRFLKFKIDVPNFNLLFLSNLISRPKNSNSAPSIWSESSSLNFSSTKILILY